MSLRLWYFTSLFLFITIVIVIIQIFSVITAESEEDTRVMSELVAELAGEQVIGVASQETIEGRSEEDTESGTETGAEGDEEEVTEVEFGEVIKGRSIGEFNEKSFVVFR